MNHPLAPPQADDERPLPVRFGSDGLIPAVVQDATSRVVLMVGFMNGEALRQTRATGRVHFWSRSRGKLWRKGETSGHEQIVQDIYVNCEQNSLLVTVHQIGAACHDGYPSCYYRRLEPDNRLVIVQDRVFDPAQVYGSADPVQPGAVAGEASRLAASTRRQVGAYRYLRDHDLASVSGTSAKLRAAEDRVSSRIGDELRELAGALDGTHRHNDLASDVRLEGGQVLYWILLAAIRGGGTWERLRPDRALLTADAGLSLETTAALLRAEAERWTAGNLGGDILPACHATIALVGQACRVAEVAVTDLIESDLAELRAKPHLGPYFADTDG